MYLFSAFYPAVVSNFKNQFSHKFAAALAVAVCFIYVSPVHAALNCTAQPACADLGYSLSVASDCPANQILLCPFDQNFKICIQTVTGENPTCPGGYSSDITTVANCGNGGATNYKFDTITLSNGTICGKCTEKSCTEKGFDYYIGEQDDAEYPQNKFNACPYGSKCEYCVEQPNHEYAKITGCESGFTYRPYAKNIANRCLTKCAVGDKLYAMWDAWQDTQKYVCSTSKPTATGYDEIGVVAILDGSESGTVMSPGVKLSQITTSVTCGISNKEDGIRNTATLQNIKSCAQSSPKRAAETVGTMSWPKSAYYLNLSPWYIPAADEISKAGKTSANASSWTSEDAGDFIFGKFYTGSGEVFCTSTDRAFLHANHYDGGILEDTITGLACRIIRFAKFVLPVYQSY